MHLRSKHSASPVSSTGALCTNLDQFLAVAFPVQPSPHFSPLDLLLLRPPHSPPRIAWAYPSLLSSLLQFCPLHSWSHPRGFGGRISLNNLHVEVICSKQESSRGDCKSDNGSDWSVGCICNITRVHESAGDWQKGESSRLHRTYRVVCRRNDWWSFPSWCLIFRSRKSNLHDLKKWKERGREAKFVSQGGQKHFRPICFS